ncbi:MAG: GTP-binding protein [Myxococcota bacterium]
MKQIPALVVSGFLGSGKTTLVRHLLEAAQAEGARVAFVSNELGELGVDQALIGEGEEAFVELAGGCVCCALNDELYETLIALRARVDPDRIVIETSGAAIPHDVQITFYQPPIRDWISEEAVVTVVNADQMAEGRDLDGAFTEQLESADLVLLHKVDLLDEPTQQIPEMTAHIQQINPGVPVITGVRGDVDPRLLFGTRSPRRPQADDAPAHHHADHTHLHDQFTSTIVPIPDGMSVEAIEARLREEGGLRVKGFVQSDVGLMVAQGVGRRMEIVPADTMPPAEMVGRVVVIRRL